MNPEHICDSYDFVKRGLLSAGPKDRPFIAVPMFTGSPTPEQEQSYQDILSIALIAEPWRKAPSAKDRQRWLEGVSKAMGDGFCDVFLDPDIGIRVPHQMPDGIHRMKFVSTGEIMYLLQQNKDALLLCFDHSLDRRGVGPSREAKLEALGGQGVSRIYYTSHASMLAASMNSRILEDWISQLKKMGVPERRLHRSQDRPEIALPQ
jgi:hypothetical protein